jgi:pyridoxal phosphate enzyme (YggS family)
MNRAALYKNTTTTRYLKIKERISLACGTHQRHAQNIRLLAVSKNQSIAKIEELFQAGQREFAENYLTELQTKAAQLKNLAISWIFIGRLQSNKIKRVVEIADEIQSVAAFKHLEYIARYAEECGKCPYPIYLEVNAGEEASKGGWQIGELPEVIARIAVEFPGLDVQGLMAIPPRFAASEAAAQAELYRLLREEARKVGRGKLSLGMSEDMEAAIAAESDCLRIGTALFGTRE